MPDVDRCKDRRRGDYWVWLHYRVTVCARASTATERSQRERRSLYFVGGAKHTTVQYLDSRPPSYYLEQVSTSGGHWVHSAGSDRPFLLLYHFPPLNITPPPPSTSPPFHLPPLGRCRRLKRFRPSRPQCWPLTVPTTLSSTRQPTRRPLCFFRPSYIISISSIAPR